MASGADVVCFSGDKLLGGPQAGIIVGKKQYIDQMKKNPLTRALRIDKMTLAALEATLRVYQDSEKPYLRIPILEMLSLPEEALRGRAEALCARLKAVSYTHLFKLGAERGVFNRVDLALKTVFPVVNDHAAPAGAEVGMVVNAEKNVQDAVAL